MRVVTAQLTGADQAAAAVGHPGGGLIDVLRVPISVVDLDLGDRPVLRPAPARPSAADAGPGPTLPTPAGTVLALVRRYGHPVGLITVEHVGATVEQAGQTGLLDVLVATAWRELGPRLRAAPERRTAERTGTLPAISVVIATRDRPVPLARCLAALTAIDYPDVEILVVDNASVGDATRLVVERFGPKARYLAEPVPGLASAHNRGLAAARGEIIAFTDDDVVVDAGWLDAIAEAFSHGDGTGCVTGLILPAELETTAQAMLERRGRFAKGFSARYFELPRRRTRSRRPDGGDRSDRTDAPEGGAARAEEPDPLFPFTAGQFGSGANMAFDAAVLRAMRGFDPVMGTGAITRGGDDLLAFFRVVAAGHRLRYAPDSLVWHFHQRDTAALARHAEGYGFGLGAYLAGALVHEPRFVPALLRRLPRGIAYALARSRPEPGAAAAWPRSLAGAELRGIALGPLAYLRGRWQGRGTPRPWEPAGRARRSVARRAGTKRLIAFPWPYGVTADRRPRLRHQDRETFPPRTQTRR